MDLTSGMKILHATTEAVPFAKTGGLGDVCGSLPIELARLGHDVAVIMPAFRHVYQANVPIEATGVSLDIPVGSKMVPGRLLRSHLPGSDVPVYLVEQDAFFDRPELYRENGQDYRDNCERFVFFSRAVLEAIRLLDLKTDLIHANDWQTALIPAYLMTEYRILPTYEAAAVVFTIHNLAFQGNFWHWDMLLTGLDWKYFNWRQMEFFGNLNFMKTGLTFADAISTVSPRYAKEIQSTPLGCGLEGVLQHHADNLTGIVNGVDYEQWNPATDTHIAAPYDAETVTKGKPVCKRQLQRELGLPEDPEAPLVATIGRLTDQKGFDLIAQVIPQWVREIPVQWVILGTGEAKYHKLLRELADRSPNKVAVRLEFNAAMAHKIEAGADVLLMPSRFEPCGLNQLFSLKYGTVPVVRATGGLADTITSMTHETMAAGTANGFAFREYSPLALSETLRQACDLYCTNRQLWQQLMSVGMHQDWSWARSARQYVGLFERTLNKRRRAVPAGESSDDEQSHFV
jgi:starch synthase